MAKIKKILREDEEPQEWEPPNWYWQKSGHPKITKEMWKNLDNNIKTGIRNFRIQNINVIGRYGIWPDWERIPEEDREYWNLKKYGNAYTQDFGIYKGYVNFANSYGSFMNDGADVIDPSERNKLYGITNSGQWYWTQTWDQEFAKIDMLPNAGPDSLQVTQQRPNWMRRSDDWVWEGRRITFIDWEHDRYVTVEATVSPVCRTIKSKRV